MELLKEYEKRDFKNLKEEEKEDKIIFHLFGDGIKEKTLEDLKEMEIFLNQHYACEIKTHILADELFHSFPKWRDNYLAYYRLLIADCLKEVDRALYLDVDMLVLEDIRALWLIDLKNKVAGVVKDQVHLAHSVRKAKQGQDFQFGDFYFNTGFLLLNLKEWRKQNIIQKCLDFLNHYQSIYHDQDSLNYALENKIIILPVAFNCFGNVFLNENERPFPLTYTQKETEECLKNPIVVHFGGNKSPWVSPFIFDDIVGVKWWEWVETMPVFKNHLKNGILERAKALFVYVQISKIKNLLLLPFGVKKIKKELYALNEKELFSYLKEYRHDDLIKIRLTDEFYAKFKKTDHAGWFYRIKLPLAIVKIKKIVDVWAENEKQKQIEKEKNN